MVNEKVQGIDVGPGFDGACQTFNNSENVEKNACTDVMICDIRPKVFVIGKLVW